MTAQFREFTLEEAIETGRKNDPGDNVPSVSRVLIAEIERLNYTDRQRTHAEDCFRWGPNHYQCALAHIAKLNGEK